MNIALWIVQGLLTLVFLMSGFMKISKSKDEIKKIGGKQMIWVDDVSANTIKLIGIVEVLAAIGLILPQLTGILPWLTPLAAVGLVLTMIGAMIVNVRNRITITKNIVLLLLAAFVAYGRFILITA